MVLPDVSSSTMQVELSAQDASVLEIGNVKAIDKAIVDRAVTARIIEILPDLLARAKEIALTSESDDSSLSALKYLIDRAAGKAVETVKHTGAITQIHTTPEEVRERLAHLRSTSS